jgi:hypothetical protein
MDFEQVKENWRFISMKSPDQFVKATLLQHHFIQFIAMADYYLIPNTHNNFRFEMEWFIKKEMLIGGWIDAKEQPVKIGGRLADLVLIIFDPAFDEIDHLDCIGKTKDEIFGWLQDKLHDLGLDTSKMEKDMFYSIPPHETDEGKPFLINDLKEELIALANLRSNANLMIRFISDMLNNDSRVKISPQYFDSECFLSKNGKDDKTNKSIRIGMAVPDQRVHHYYFYVSLLNNGNKIDQSLLEKPGGDGYWINDNENKAVLPLDQLYKDKNGNDQVQRVFNFFKSALDNSADILKTPYFKIS